MISTAIRVARVGSAAELAAAVLMMLGYPGLMAAALVPSAPAFAAAAAVTYLADLYLHRKGSRLIGLLGKVRAGLSTRFLVRELLLILLLARLDLAEEPVFYAAIACFTVFFGLQAPHGALVTLIGKRRQMPVVTRNVDLASRLRIPDAPPRSLLSRATVKMLHLDLAAVVGLLVCAIGDSVAPGYAGIAVTLGLGGLYVVALVPYLRAKRLPPKADKVLGVMSAWLREYRPQTVLYFSGSDDSAYQVNMWLETMEQMESRPLVILRERTVLEKMAPTSVPVVCVPGGAPDEPGPVHGAGRVVLRERRQEHPPAARADHEARLHRPRRQRQGRQRQPVQQGVRRGVDRRPRGPRPLRHRRRRHPRRGHRGGRPSAAGADQDRGRRTRGSPRRSRHLLPDGSVRAHMGGLGRQPGQHLAPAGRREHREEAGRRRAPVRVLYKPHPFTGTRSAKAGAAHRRIVALIKKAAAQRAGDSRFTADPAAQARAKAELTRLKARLDGLSLAFDERADEAVTSRDGIVDVRKHEEAARLRAEWNETYWRSFPSFEHRVITGTGPRLYDCFNASEAMVSDISSVVSDFIASGKPYAVADSAELGAEEFRRQNTAVRAAVILGNSAAELDQLLDAVRDPASDPLAKDRRELKEYLLGPDEPTSIQRFDTAITDLALKSEARNVGQESHAAGADGAVGAAPDDAAELPKGVTAV